MKCPICTIVLVDGKPPADAMPCLLAPRHYIKRSIASPDKVFACVDGCPYEEPHEPDFLAATAMKDLTAQEKRDAIANVEKYYENPQDFRPSGHWQNHTIAFIDRR